MAKKARGSAASADQVQTWMARAVALHHAGDYVGAATLYRQALRAQRHHPGALNGLAMVEFRQGRLDRAVTLLERAMRVTGPHPGQLMNLGAVHDAAGHAGEAEDCYRRAITLAPRYPDPYYNLGALYLGRQQPDDAVRVFEACQTAVGRDFHALAYQAHALRDAGRHTEAEWLLDHARLVHRYRFDPPAPYATLAAFNAAVADHVRGHPSLREEVMATVGGSHTGELLAEPLGPMALLEPIIRQAVDWYRARLPAEPAHPAVRWAPSRWKLCCWGVVMGSGGHERSHIHPKGWISGVLYVELPDLIDDPQRGHEGWLRFGEPSPELNVQSAPVLRDYQPAYGNIILFPAYFYHGTVPFHSDQRRVCVSFDVEPL